MRVEDFQPASPGVLARSMRGHWVYNPNPLPPELNYTVDVVQTLSRADQALGALRSFGNLLPNPHLLIRPFVRREAVLSSRIEGTVTQLGQLLLFEADTDQGAPDDDVAEVLNYIDALDYGLAQLSAGVPLCLRLLREVHARLMAGVRGANLRPGEFRGCGVMIGRHGQTFEQARFVPPEADTLPGLLRDFEQFLNTPGSLSVVVQLALAHYQFEAIHPFMDGNGRLGRLLITLLLCARGVLPHPLLYLSAYLEAHGNEYRDGLLAVSQRGEWEEWIRFIAYGVAEQAEDAVSRARRLMDLQANYQRRARAAGRPTPVFDLIDRLFASPAITISGAERLMGVAYTTAQRHVNWLVAERMLREVSGRTRNRVYAAPEIFRLLDATTGPEVA